MHNVIMYIMYIETINTQFFLVYYDIKLNYKLLEIMSIKKLLVIKIQV